MRRLCGCLSALLLSALAPWAASFEVRVHAWAAPTLGVHQAATGAGAGVSVAIASGLTDGSTLVVNSLETGAGLRTISTVADNVAGSPNTYTPIQGPITSTGTGGNRRCWQHYAKNIVTTSGALTLTVTFSNTDNFVVHVTEILGASTTAPFDTSANHDDAGSTNSHVFATSPGITTAATDIFVAAAATSNGSLTSITPASGFTDLSGDANVGTASTVQVLSSASGLSANTLAWSNSSTARNATNCVSSFVATASAAASIPNGLSLLGAGQ